VVSANVGRGGVRLERAASWQVEQNATPAEGDVLGKSLREKLKAAGIAPAPVLATVGRDRLILKDLRYPAVPAHEEPAIVRFQAAKELTDSPDDVVIDYTRLGEAPPGSEQRALGLVLRRDLLVAHQNLCKAAGLKLLALSPRPLGMLAYVRDIPGAEAGEATRAVLAVTRSWAEFCIVRGDQPLLARSLAAGDTLAGEVVRNIRVFAGQSALSPVTAIYLAGGEDQQGLRQRLTALLSLPVIPLDPLDGAVQAGDLPTGQGAFLGPVGLLHASRAPGGLAINFARPKQPAPPRPPHQRYLAMGAGVVAALVLAGVCFGYMQISSKDQLIDNLFLQQQELDRQLARLNEDDEWIKVLDEWDQSGIVWLDELYDLTASFPDINSLRLTGLTGMPLNRGAKDKHVAKMTLSGESTNDQTINSLQSRLLAEASYRVAKRDTAPNRSGTNRFRFPMQFDLQIDMQKRPPAQYLREIEQRRRGSESEGFDFMEDAP
jgi:Tfp pilus assembly PilM family ATPase